MTDRVGSLSIRVEDGITRMFDQACGNCPPCLRGHLLACEHHEPVGCEVLRGTLPPEVMTEVVLAAAAFGSCDVGPDTSIVVLSDEPALHALVDYLQVNPRPDSDRSERVNAMSADDVVVVTDAPVSTVIERVPTASVIVTSSWEADGQTEAGVDGRRVVVARPRAVQDLVNRTGDRKAIETLLS